MVSGLIHDSDIRQCEHLLGELLPREARTLRLVFDIRHNVKFINAIQRHLEEVVFVLPNDLGFCESFTLSWSSWRISDLSDEVRCGRLCNTVHQNTNERRSQDDGEGKGKAEQNAFAISEPATLLLWREFDSAEIRLQLFC